MSAAKPKLTRQSACNILARAEKTQSFVNILLDDRFKQYRHLLPIERALITEMVYGVLRNQRLIDLLLSHFSTVKPERMERRTLLALRLGAYQIAFMQKIPEALAVNESVNLVRAPSRPLVNAVLRTICRRKKQIANLIDELLRPYPTAQMLALKYSHPDWLVERWVEKFGKDFIERWLQKNNEPAPLFARANTLKIGRDELVKKLEGEGLVVKPCERLPDCFAIEGASSLGTNVRIKQGLFVIQDMASQLVSYFVDPKPSEKILDACAAPGTKTTHITQLAKDKAKIVATDINESKLKLLSDSAIRLGIKSITTVQFDWADDKALSFNSPFSKGGLGGFESPSNPPFTKGEGEISCAPFDANSFDRVLVDAPCANLGLFRRHPELRLKREPADVAEMAELQLKILNAVANLTRAGGFLIYSVCSISSEENEGVVNSFLKDNPNYEVAEPPEFVKKYFSDAIGEDTAVRTFPHLHDSDGFFIIRMRRKR